MRVEIEKQLTYADGSSKMIGVTIVTDERNGSRTFTISSKEGQVGENESAISAERRRAPRRRPTA